MIEKSPLERFLESALAFAHAALEDPSHDRLADARRYAAEVAPRMEKVKRLELTLAEARQIVLLMRQLRAVLAVVDARARPAQAKAG